MHTVRLSPLSQHSSQAVCTLTTDALLSLSLSPPKTQMTDLRTWVRYTKRCAPAGNPATGSSSRRESTPRPGQKAATVEGLSSSSSPPQGGARRRRRGGGRQPALQGDVESGLAEAGSWKEGGDSSDSGGGASLGEAAGLKAEMEGAVDGGGGRTRPAEASGLGPDGEWPGFGGGGRGGEKTESSTFEEEGEVGRLYSSEGGKATEDAGNGGGWLGRPRWWQRLQHYVGGPGTENLQQQQQQQGREGEEQAWWEEEDEEVEGDGDDDAQEDELIGNVHFGFCEYYQTLVAEGLADTISRLARKHPSYGILVTGHSLGAAAAAVCAADLVQRLGIERDRVVLYTLGEPRTGDGIFAEGVNDRVVRVIRVCICVCM